MKYWTDQFQLCLSFCIVRLNIYILFVHWQQWCSQPKIFWRVKMFDFRPVTIFCLGCHLSEHEMTIYAKNIAGAWHPGPPDYAYDWQHNWHPYRQLAGCYICLVLSLHSGIYRYRMSIQSCYLCSRQARNHGGANLPCKKFCPPGKMCWT